MIVIKAGCPTQINTFSPDLGGIFGMKMMLINDAVMLLLYDDLCVILTEYSVDDTHNT